MNQATAFVQKISDNQELAVTVMDGAKDLFNYSRKYLNSRLFLISYWIIITPMWAWCRQDGNLEFDGEEGGHYRVALE